MASKAVREAKDKERRDKMAGEGVFLMRNVSKSVIILPKPSLDTPQKSQIAPGELFHGDTYHLESMKVTGSVRVVDTEVHPDVDEDSRPTHTEVVDPVTGVIRRVPLSKDGKIMDPRNEILDAEYELVKGGKKTTTPDGVPD